VPVAHPCNPSYLKGWDLRSGRLSLQTNTTRDSGRTHIKNTIATRTGGISQGIECLICKKKTLRSNHGPPTKSYFPSTIRHWRITHVWQNKDRAWKEPWYTTGENKSEYIILENSLKGLQKTKHWTVQSKKYNSRYATNNGYQDGQDGCTHMLSIVLSQQVRKRKK
jgi:hypothetical protein